MRPTLAALCHYFPGYTLASLRDLPLRDFNLLAETAREMTKGDD